MTRACKTLVDFNDFKLNCFHIWSNSASTVLAPKPFHDAYGTFVVSKIYISSVKFSTLQTEISSPLRLKTLEASAELLRA